MSLTDAPSPRRMKVLRLSFAVLTLASAGLTMGSRPASASGVSCATVGCPGGNGAPCAIITSSSGNSKACYYRD